MIVVFLSRVKTVTIFADCNWPGELKLQAKESQIAVLKF